MTESQSCRRFRAQSVSHRFYSEKQSGATLQLCCSGVTDCRFEDKARQGSATGLSLVIACSRFISVCLHAETSLSTKDKEVFLYLKKLEKWKHPSQKVVIVRLMRPLFLKIHGTNNRNRLIHYHRCFLTIDRFSLLNRFD